MTAPDEAQTEVTDSPTGWVAKHIRSYVESDGEQGHHNLANAVDRLCGSMLRGYGLGDPLRST